MKTLVVGVAGGSGSGKTTIARAIFEALPKGSAALLEHDSYYKDLSTLDHEARARVNFDHPDSLDNKLFALHLDALRAGQPIEKPVYDFATHARLRETLHVAAAPVIMVEGILVLADPELRARMDVKVFVDTDADIRVMRRIRRDLEQRGRTFSQVRAQYYETVRPMHQAFVEPSKRFADLIVPEGGENRVALAMIAAHLRAHLASSEGAL
ncbi:MAG: uridine kinase [Deltaproteobacteria bacterium]|nr:uridine kinase [Deltaproteobacteria bacterium]